MTFADEEEFEDRVMEMDWGEDEEDRPKSANIFEEKRPKSREPETPRNKFADIMAKAPSPQVNP